MQSALRAGHKTLKLPDSISFPLDTLSVELKHDTGTWFTGVLYTIPSLALYALLVAPLGLGTAPAVAALALYSVLPVLRNTVVGLTEVPADAIEAARGMGMTETQALWRVRLPLALPVVVGGVRVAAVTAVGVASVAALVAAGGLGDSIFAGLRTNDSTEVLAATFLIAALALAVDGSLALLERGLRRGP